MPEPINPSRPDPSPVSSRRRRSAPALWISGSAAAFVLVLGTSGTLASWTEALITNDTNTTASAEAVILQESSGATTCDSSQGAQSVVNASTCSGINKYGGTATPLLPGATSSTDVTFRNIGSADASSFTLTPGTCSQTPAAGSGTPAVGDLCDSGALTVAVSCSPGASFAAGSAWTDLKALATAPPSAALDHAAASGDLDAGAAWTCRITTALISTASVLNQGVTLSQPLSWTLTQ